MVFLSAQSPLARFVQLYRALQWFLIISPQKTVSGVKIARNTVTNGLYGLRIKVNIFAVCIIAACHRRYRNNIADIADIPIL